MTHERPESRESEIDCYTTANEVGALDGLIVVIRRATISETKGASSSRLQRFERLFAEMGVRSSHFRRPRAARSGCGFFRSTVSALRLAEESS